MSALGMPSGRDSRLSVLHREELGWLAVPGGAVDDRPAVRRKAAVQEIAPAGRELPEGHLAGQEAFGRRLTAREERERERGGYRRAEEDAAPNRSRARRGDGRRADTDGLRQMITKRGEVAREVARRGVALLGILGQAALDDPAQRRRDLRVQRPRSAPAPRSGSPPACRRRSSSETLSCPSPSRTGSSRRRTGRSGSRPAARSPARATCSRPSPRPRPASFPSRREVRSLAAARPPSDVSFARPKSRILTSPSFVTITFSGFRSRCTIPASCALARPSAICGRDLEQPLDRQRPADRAAPAASSPPPAPSRCRRRESDVPMS